MLIFWGVVCIHFNSQRKGEKDGVHYNFTDIDTMREDINEGKFVEFAYVHGNYYGTTLASVKSVQRDGKICILDIDVNGVGTVKKSSLDAIYIFIKPPSMNELEKRLRKLGIESEEEVMRRMKNAKREMHYGMQEDNFDKVFTNDDLDATFELLDAQFQKWYPQLRE